MRENVLSGLIAVCLVGCASGDSLSEFSSSLSSFSVYAGATVKAQTFDGYPAYGCAYDKNFGTACANFNVWTDNGINTYGSDPGGNSFESERGFGYQCVELATRYEWARWGVSGWTIQNAFEMCANHPASMTITNDPMPGDLMVFGPFACASSNSGITDPGHVAVVNSVGATTITTAQQNTAAIVNWPRSCLTGTQPLGCFLHPIANGGTPPPPSCPCYTGNGAYCGAEVANYASAHNCTTQVSINGSSLYSCQNSIWSLQQACSNGCWFNPHGADRCYTYCSCYSGNGVYCGAQAVDYASNNGCTFQVGVKTSDTYNCSGGNWSLNQVCGSGCSFNSHGPDYCNSACGGTVCGANCCGSADWCGVNNRCCSDCGPGCRC
jgi:hypothetical protein